MPTPSAASRDLDNAAVGLDGGLPQRQGRQERARFQPFDSERARGAAWAPPTLITHDHASHLCCVNT
jgi:hypothetical protein